MTFVTKLLRKQLELTKPFVDGASIETNRMGQDKLGELMARIRQESIVCVKQSVGEIPGMWVLPRAAGEEENGRTEKGGVIYYLHGGGYIAGDLNYAKGCAATFASETGRRAFCIAYRLAPEHPFPAALEDALEGYRFLLERGYTPGQIVFAGESAGGGLCYALCLKLRELGLPLPAGIVVSSPWTDLTASGTSYAVNRDIDPSMAVERLDYFARCYTDDRTDPLVSPIFGELGGMPPSLIFVGGDEVMLDDAAIMHRRLLAAGCRSELVIAPELWHAYLLYGIKEREGDFEKISQFCSEVIK